MAELKTKPTQIAVEDFIAAVDHPGKQADARVLDAIFRRVTGQEPQMWGPTIIGYGRYRYTYDSGHSGEMCRVGFSPRKPKHSLYLLCTCHDPEGDARAEQMLARLGKYSRGKACLYVNKLADVDLAVLEELVAHGWDTMNRLYPE